jgi:ATP diphosphatase
VLFVVANLARHLQLDPEGALRAANQKFTRRFHHIEQRLREDGRPPENVTLEELDAWWDEAKATEKARK